MPAFNGGVRVTMAMLKVTAQVWTVDGWRRFRVRGQEARSLLALAEAGERGRTALEVSAWALRFAAYCHKLIHRHGLTILTERENHPGGWHGRHILLDRVEILSVESGDGREVA